ncbi:phenylpyruvate tautomerase MIF-related protein [Clostridium folliculivorans]|uniref:L-dopachrome isomerase n=1 Tax=Clostridium folliculivorans TaxID=2886038 RepID=A0A9W5Y3T1_9CLOT|nr:phenylpyruvate tautomerase MIF-related protein [Clostridium folliculivorans]GKU26199.1 hypothetical protein CFOLD11_30260 [Clostridium folliculivorans]GKU31871.1 hypothetical protein CFB3_39790 [Clostridium folliculivorans]
MPFIDSKVTVKLTEEKKDKIKDELGKLIELIPGKSEQWLMVGFQDEYPLYFKGDKLEYGAFIEVKIFGSTSKEALSKLTKAICELYEEELSISKESIYVKYEEVNNWGWNGENF